MNEFTPKSLLHSLPSDYLKKGHSVKFLGKIQAIFSLPNGSKQFQINHQYYHESIVNQCLTNPFKLSTAHRITSLNFSTRSDRLLVKDFYQIKRYIKTITKGDLEELIEGNYFSLLCSSSASGLVPVEPWLLSQLNFAQELVEQELTRRDHLFILSTESERSPH